MFIRFRRERLINQEEPLPRIPAIDFLPRITRIDTALLNAYGPQTTNSSRGLAVCTRVF